MKENKWTEEDVFEAKMRRFRRLNKGEELSEVEKSEKKGSDKPDHLSRSIAHSPNHLKWYKKHGI